ncbi:MAG: sialidase family protein [Acutalibacteraceae bacterium]|nr:sialidase family protein [Acutalibacteraceae bacterium]
MKEFIFENKPTESCHASTVLPLDDGRVVAAWFAGTKESADDVDILTSVRSESGWSEPARVSADSNIPHWNPVLFRRADGKIMLFFKVGKKIPMWKTYFSLSDNGVDWSESAELVPGDISGGRGPVKNKPIRLRSGRIYRSDSSDEGETWCRAYRTKMPNNNSGIDLVLAGNGKIYLVCNPVKKNWGGRSPLDLLVSEDGGETFNLLMRLEDREGGEFSYPAITERDGVLHITYTYDREYIAYRQIKI